MKGDGLMAFFSKLFGKSSSPKQREEKIPSYYSTLDVFIIYEGDVDSDEREDEFTDLEDELWVYRSLGESGVMSSETAENYGIPLPAFPEYPLIGVFKLNASKGYTEGYSKPLFISSKKEEVKQFLEEYERTH